MKSKDKILCLLVNQIFFTLTITANVYEIDGDGVIHYPTCCNKLHHSLKMNMP